MAESLDIKKLVESATITDQYKKQIARLVKQGKNPDLISEAVDNVLKNLPKLATNSLVIYGDPQSGKTEMMICLTARLLDEGRGTIVHLMNDSVDLLTQSLDRFRSAGLAPSPRNSGDLANSPLTAGQSAVLFCKKNAKDLPKLIEALKKSGPVTVIDDEADFATPNAKINKQEQTTINKLISGLLGKDGVYIGVTATPARLNLNNTFNIGAHKRRGYLRY